MATCHTLRSLNGELLGDPLELKMFEFTGWVFEEGSQSTTSSGAFEGTSIRPPVVKPRLFSQSPTSDSGDHLVSYLEHIILFFSNRKQGSTLELGILRSFEFIPQLRRQSVIVRRLGDSGVTIYAKGAPESIQEICAAESSKSPYATSNKEIQHLHQIHHVCSRDGFLSLIFRRCLKFPKITTVS